jgi:hypothetical protein
MTEHNLMDPGEFADRMRASFGLEPPHPAVDADLAFGRRRLRRHRATVALGGLAVAAMVSGGALAAPGVLPGAGPQDGGYAAAGEEPSAQEVVADCLGSGNYITAERGEGITPARLRERLGAARLVTTATTEERTVATLVSEDGAHWGDCQLASAPESGVKDYLAVYPTDVSFPARKVRGVDAYEPHDEADPRLEGTATPGVPNVQVTCVVGEPEETPEYNREGAACPTFTMTWNDRRPAEVAAVKVVSPDGKASWADVHEGYLSFAYTGEMTPEIAARVARGDYPGAKRVVFYDADGEVLVDDRDPGHLPGRGELSILSFPSLAWWLR